MGLKVENVRKITVIGGGGSMGHGIVLACIQAGPYEVTILSRKEKTCQYGLDLIQKGPYGLARAVKREKMTQEQADEAFSRVKTTTDYAQGLEGADLVFESIIEDKAIKKECFREVEKHVPDHCVIASGTSAIMISEMAGAMTTMEKNLVGTHWFFPSNVMPLVEVGRSELTSEETFHFIMDFLTKIGKRPFAVKDSPGFFMTRFINTYITEAIRLVELGIANISDIDMMNRMGSGWPMGVFELLDDTASFDAYYHAQSYLYETLGDRYRVPALARKVFEAGYIGHPQLKPGSKGGWYEFFGEEKKYLSLKKK
ncbi:MAG: 3-hydroxyacyl-CoA dehydrogenase NAD-binding domain-containing protein [Desulfobacteraceae bacterium]